MSISESTFFEASNFSAGYSKVKPQSDSPWHPRPPPPRSSQRRHVHKLECRNLGSLDKAYGFMMFRLTTCLTNCLELLIECRGFEFVSIWFLFLLFKRRSHKTRSPCFLVPLCALPQMIASAEAFPIGPWKKEDYQEQKDGPKQ